MEIMEIKIWPKNRERYQEYRNYVSGIASNGSLVVIEYISSSKGSREMIVANLEENRIWHNCMATKNKRPCWHLAAVADIAGWALPHVAKVAAEQYPRPLPTDIQDITLGHLGRPGDFQLISLKESQAEAEPAETPPELPPEDAWLADYKLPARVLEKVLRFREAQKSRLAPEQVMRVPKPRYVPSGRELAAAVAALVYGEEGGHWEAPLLIGPKGSGKSTLAETLAAILHLPVNKIFGGVDVNAEHLLGSKTLAPSEDGIDPATEAKLRAAAKQAGVDVGYILQKLRGAQLQIGRASCRERV